MGAGLATATFDVATQKAKVVVTKSVEVADQNVDLKGTWTQKVCAQPNGPSASPLRSAAAAA